MAVVDLAKWQAAGIPAELAVLVVEINRALLRVPPKGDAGRGIASLASSIMGGGITVTLTDGSTVTVNDLRAALAEDDAAAIADALARTGAGAGAAEAAAASATEAVVMVTAASASAANAADRASVAAG